MTTENSSNAGKWTALLAAILGWMFDGFEIGLFPLVARPALIDLLGLTKGQPGIEGIIGQWNGIITAGFLVGAATGGVLFGWLGDRIGRVRAMALSILTYALFSGLCGFSSSAYMLLSLRLIASLGMGGEWALGVSLVMELWPSQSRGWLAGLIGAAANVGFILVALVSIGLTSIIGALDQGFRAVGFGDAIVDRLVSNGGWRILMLCGAVPALMTFFIRMFVPESEKWLHEHGKGTTSNWATKDLLGVLFGAMGPIGMIYLWSLPDTGWVVRTIGCLVGLSVAAIGYTYPVARYLHRVSSYGPIVGAGGRSVRSLMIMGAILGGVALLGTWGSTQWAAPWADKLTEGKIPNAKAYTQIALGIGAIIGTIAAAVIGHKFGRRITYAGLCALSLATTLTFFLTNNSYDTRFLLTGFLAGAMTASFYGWLPLYLPELFPTRVRATGQGFAFNFGRILAAAGSLQTGAMMGYFETTYGKSYPYACSVMSLVYLVGLVAIWFAPETHGHDLPE